MNHVVLIGNVGKDPDIKNFPNDGKIASFSLATSKRWKNDKGEPQERTDWHNITVKQKGLAGLCEQYVKKGDKLAISGEIQNRSYDDKDGNKKYITEIVAAQITFLTPKGEGGAKPAPAPTNNTAKEKVTTSQTGEANIASQFDDDLPF